jgi:hypothetical protein
MIKDTRAPPLHIFALKMRKGNVTLGISMHKGVIQVTMNQIIIIYFLQY